MFTPEPLESMRQRWLGLVQNHGNASVDPRRVFDALAAVYSGPERYYHNLEHLAEMFRVADRLAPEIDDPAAVELAIWFHDAIYDPRSKDNEAHSARLAAEQLAGLSVPAPVIEKVTRLVRATAHLASAEPPADRDTAALLDADLAILGAPAARYRRYATDIRREYGFVPDTEYQAGRAAVLKTFLARPRLFRHRLTFAEFEEQARDNMTAELRELGG
jgi:predicted metal-dependent HD superfamily phosphohydrolase